MGQLVLVEGGLLDRRLAHAALGRRGSALDPVRLREDVGGRGVLGDVQDLLVTLELEPGLLAADPDLDLLGADHVHERLAPGRVAHHPLELVAEAHLALDALELERRHLLAVADDLALVVVEACRLPVLVVETALVLDRFDARPERFASGLLHDRAADHHHRMPQRELAEDRCAGLARLRDQPLLLSAQHVELRIGLVDGLDRLDLAHVVGQPAHDAVAQPVDLLEALFGEQHGLPRPLHALDHVERLAAECHDPRRAADHRQQVECHAAHRDRDVLVLEGALGGLLLQLGDRLRAVVGDRDPDPERRGRREHRQHQRGQVDDDADRGVEDHRLDVLTQRIGALLELHVRRPERLRLLVPRREGLRERAVRV